MDNKTYLGIELGSTRIKAVLIDQKYKTIATGSFDWENKLEDGIWTYSLDDAWVGVQTAYANLVKQDNINVEEISAIGFSGMMHGYLPFDKNGKQLTNFRTWRNTTTEKAADALSKLFSFNVPQRWSVAHLYQAIINKEAHVKHIDYMTTLAGYIHWRLTDKKVVGVGEASGMFPINSESCTYYSNMVSKFDDLIKNEGLNWKMLDIFPKVLNAGDSAGTLTESGAKLLDPTGKLKSGIPLCAPEGDAGTGMVATNSVAIKTGNISAGTSVFAMTVLEKPLSKMHLEIDIVTTPHGKSVAMAHCNTCTSDLDAWVKLLGEMGEASGTKLTKNELYELLYKKALEGAPDCGGLISFNYYAGEPITDVSEGRPLFIRTPNSKLNLANFMRSHVYSTMATLKIGMDILFVDEKVEVDKLLGHGGLFKVRGVSQSFMASALGVSIGVMETASEGGPWGMAVLATYLVNKNTNETLECYLEKVFKDVKVDYLLPNDNDVAGFADYLERFKKCLAIEKAAVQAI